jgi:hypothetical protein
MLTRADVKQSRLQRVEGPPAIWGLSIPERIEIPRKRFDASKVDNVLLTGADAVMALSQVLPVIAGTAGSKKQVRAAVDLVERHVTLESLVARTRLEASKDLLLVGKLGKLGPESRLALEMVANENSERRWLEGELKLLEWQWREANRLAAIADDLAVPGNSDGEAKRLSS